MARVHTAVVPVLLNDMDSSSTDVVEYTGLRLVRPSSYSQREMAHIYCHAVWVTRSSIYHVSEHLIMTTLTVGTSNSLPTAVARNPREGYFGNRHQCVCVG